MPVGNSSMSQTQKPVLGKGLASLLSGAPTPAASTPAPESAAPMENKDRHPGIALTSPEDIHINPYQPRRDFDDGAIEELAQSIRINGIIQPLVVRKTDKG